MFTELAQLMLSRVIDHDLVTQAHHFPVNKPLALHRPAYIPAVNTRSRHTDEILISNFYIDPQYRGYGFGDLLGIILNIHQLIHAGPPPEI